MAAAVHPNVPGRDVMAGGRKCPFDPDKPSFEGLATSGLGPAIKLSNLEDKRLIVSEVALRGVPASGEEECRVRLRFLVGDTLVRTLDLPPREISTWPTNLQPDADEVMLILFEQRAQGELAWVERARGQLKPIEAFTAQDEDIVQRKVPLACEGDLFCLVSMVLEHKVAATKSHITFTRDGAEGVKVSAALRALGVEEASKVTREMKLAALEQVKALAAELPLTDVQIVIIKDSYNKVGESPAQIDDEQLFEILCKSRLEVAWL
jgi:hypothetical protein